MAGERPLPLPPGFVQDLQDAMGPDGVIAPRVDLAVGDQVRIQSGPFASLIGTLHEMDSRGRIAVLIELLNGTVRLQLDRSALAPAA